MPECDIVDTFPAFVRFWEGAKRLSLEAQIELWLTKYMSEWPELLARQQRSYSEQGIEWLALARERVFPFLPEWLPLMREAREGLLACLPGTYDKARQNLGLDFDVFFVIYVGIGCGAGWASSFEGVPACLFGLENIAERGWTEQETLAALAAHELGHLLHQRWRCIHGLTSGRGPFWQLYEEGFAQRCEHAIMGKNTWHEGSKQRDWLMWCNENRAWLATEFLRTADRAESARPFFGSWFNIRGYSQCGYFLGHEVIREWQDTMDLNDVALLPSDDALQRARESLERMSDQAARTSEQPV
jgi:hypothetical protein